MAHRVLHAPFRAFSRLLTACDQGTRKGKGSAKDDGGYQTDKNLEEESRSRVLSNKEKRELKKKRQKDEQAEEEAQKNILEPMFEKPQTSWPPYVW